ncbi:hypothetical protein VTK26DRAFT_3915 [Humicola hyalothermophila]
MTAAFTCRYEMSRNPACMIESDPSPIEKEVTWPRRYLSPRTSSERGSADSGEIEAFTISRESFDSYRRSFDISAKSPVSPAQDTLPPRHSLDSRFARGDHQPPYHQKPRRSRFLESPAEAEESSRFEEVGLGDEESKPEQQQQQQEEEENGGNLFPRRKGGFLAKFASSSSEAPSTAASTTTNPATTAATDHQTRTGTGTGTGPGTVFSKILPFGLGSGGGAAAAAGDGGRRHRAQSGHGAQELGPMPRPSAAGATAVVSGLQAQEVEG